MTIENSRWVIIVLEIRLFLVYRYVLNKLRLLLIRRNGKWFWNFTILSSLGCIMHWEWVLPRQNVKALSIVYAFWLNKSGWTLIKGEEKIMVILNPLSQRYGFIAEIFTGDSRQGQEMKRVVITKRFYQVSANSSQAWFSK